MIKIAISLASGNQIEKPLVSAFRGSAGEYIVLDNEANGTMGLPIILVAKLVNNKLTKIEDQNEWGTVKEMLRNIISGNQVDYINVAPNLTGDDIFYSQLTLPIASFEALKNNYKPIDNGVGSIPSPNPMNIPNAVPNPSQTVSPVTPIPNNNPTGFVNPIEPPIQPTVPMPEQAPMGPSPIGEPTSTTAFVNNIPQPSEVAPQEIPTAPVVEPIPTGPESIDYTAEKEAFLKACENMFDALVAKFNK